MKNRPKYWHFAPIGLLLLVVGLIAGSKNKNPSSSVTTTECSVNIVDEKRSYLPECDTLEEETVCAIPETAENGMVSISPEIEDSYAIEGIASYENLNRFPADIVFASEESVKLVADIYAEIGFEGEFQSGDETVYEFYRQKFALLLDGKVKIYDSKGNESLLYDRYIPMGHHQIRIQDGDEIYFFDMDGDGVPELCVQGSSGTYVCKYDTDTDRYTEWWGTTDSGCMILGTRKMADTYYGDIDRLYLFNKDGYLECKITFNTSYQSGILYWVSVPDFEERVNDGKIPDSMKQQIVYDEFGRTYYLRVKREQYKEFIKRLYEAEKAAEKHQVPFLYFFDSED